ncbi:hypothetical protein FPOA_14096 [Fusarium poae]|uniref:HAT C-terminal dimerisation domain-containing protein n=1 Tax=Fusarium poae TaxID=36050 RepID=A0A1B8A3N7_FUSPO|nr:hypothetical protein FPOA_14096 [Fusarium poae]
MDSFDEGIETASTTPPPSELSTISASMTYATIKFPDYDVWTADHLESKHQIDRETGERRHAKRHPSQPSIVDFNNISTLVFKRRFDEFKELLIRWIVYCHIAFFQIENLYFRELLFYIFPGLTTLLPKARLVVRRWIIEAFEARKDSLRQEMQTAHSNISISFDIWTSPNYQAILGCVAHFINRSGKRRTVVLALRELVGEHSGENMADVLLHIFDDYGISGRIGYFMADNASSNDACIDLALKALYPNMSRKHRVRRRLRCFGHIVNFCAQAFIMGKDAAKTCKDLDSAYREGDYSRIRELWKKRGAIGRLRNIVRYIRASPQRRQFFRSIQIGGDLAAFDGLELVQSQSTRWNSYFLSIGRALNVKERIQLFCDQYEPPQSDRDVLDQRLSPRQWDELGHLHDQLETFYEATVMNEGRQWTLADHFQSLDWLMDEIHLARRKFEQLAEDALRKRGPNRQDKHDEFDDYNWLAAAAEVAWQKCEKYYNKADESPAYYAAISLNPSLKNQWYYQVWNGSDDKRAWIQAAVGAVKELWVDEYKGKFAHGAPVPTHVFKSPEPKEKPFTSVRNHKRLKLRHTDPHSSPELPSTDHYNEFITTDVIGLNDDEEFDPIQYWNERYHSQTDLARMALDVLALPPMSDECERLFSSAKLLLTDHRSRLRMDVIEASECLRAWYGRPEQKAFEDSAIGLMEGEAGSTVGADGPGEGELPVPTSGLDWIEARIQLQSNPITSLQEIPRTYDIAYAKSRSFQEKPGNNRWKADVNNRPVHLQYTIPAEDLPLFWTLVVSKVDEFQLTTKSGETVPYFKGPRLLFQSHDLKNTFGKETLSASLDDFESSVLQALDPAHLDIHSCWIDIGARDYVASDPPDSTAMRGPFTVLWKSQCHSYLHEQISRIAPESRLDAVKFQKFLLRDIGDYQVKAKCTRATNPGHPHERRPGVIRAKAYSCHKELFSVMFSDYEIFGSCFLPLLALSEGMLSDLSANNRGRRQASNTTQIGRGAL